MPAYVIVGEDITDAEGHAEYACRVPATLEPFDGRFAVRGGAFEVVEGAWPAPRTVVIAFPDLERARGWYGSPAYQEILPLRLRAATTHFLVFAEGTA